MSVAAGIVAEAMALVKRMSVAELLDFRSALIQDGLFDTEESVALPVADAPSNE